MNYQHYSVSQFLTLHTKVGYIQHKIIHIQKYSTNKAPASHWAAIRKDNGVALGVANEISGVANAELKCVALANV